VYIREELRPGISKIPRPGAESICLKLDRHFFSLQKDIYLIFAYCSPSNSTVLRREGLKVFEDLNDLVSEVSEAGNIIIAGDFNARTRVENDFLSEDDNTHVPIPPSEWYDTNTTGSVPRNNLDVGTNSYGPKLLELCKTLSLRILNGRKLGDLLGHMSCFTARGSSLVDYVLASPSLFNRIPDFKIGLLYPTISDHTPVSFSLVVNVRDAQPCSLTE